MIDRDLVTDAVQGLISDAVLEEIANGTEYSYIGRLKVGDASSVGRIDPILARELQACRAALRGIVAACPRSRPNLERTLAAVDDCRACLPREVGDE